MTIPNQALEPTDLQGVLLGRLDELGTAMGSAHNMINSMDRRFADELLAPGLEQTGTLRFALHDLEVAVDKISRYAKRAAYAADVEAARAKLKRAEDRYAEVAGPGTPGSG